VVFVLSVLNIIHVLDLESVCLIPSIYTIIILHNVLLLTGSISYLLLCGFRNVKKISYHSTCFQDLGRSFHILK